MLHWPPQPASPNLGSSQGRHRTLSKKGKYLSSHVWQELISVPSPHFRQCSIFSSPHWRLLDSNINNNNKSVIDLRRTLIALDVDKKVNILSEKINSLEEDADRNKKKILESSCYNLSSERANS